jgi:hypothetical protein
MPRFLSDALRACLERENPRVHLHAEVMAEDVARVLRRANDQFFSSPPRVSESPVAGLVASPGGGMQIVGTNTTLANFTGTASAAALDPDVASLRLKALGFRADPAFPLARLRNFASSSRSGVRAESGCTTRRAPRVRSGPSPRSSRPRRSG